MPTGYPHLPARVVQLDNGLRALLLQDARSSQLAIAAGVPAGSLDEPPAWPGMAHFLEHALFLGSASAPGSGEFARRIQQAGGRYNARTLHCQTLYHLEVPASHGDEALALLLDLLTRPLLAAERLQAERGVLDAEYRARCADPYSQAFAAVSQCLNPAHPLTAFHAGHAASLPVEDEDFRAALHAWHHAHYATDQIHLLLCGPQSLDPLQALLTQQAGHLQGHGHPPPRDWPALWPAQPPMHLRLDQNAPLRMSLWLPLPAHPQQDSLRQQLELLLQASHPGSLLHELRARQQARQLACNLHDGGGQQLLEISLLLEPAAAGHEPAIAARLRDQLAALCTNATAAALPVFAHSSACALAWEEMALPAMERALRWLQRWMQQPDCQPWAQWPAAGHLQHWLRQQPEQAWLLQSCLTGCAEQHTRHFPVGYHVGALEWPAARRATSSLASTALQQATLADAADRQPWPAVWQRDEACDLPPGHGLLVLDWQLPPPLAGLGLPLRLALDRAWQQEQGEARLLGCSCSSAHEGPHLRLELQGPLALNGLLATRLCSALQQQTAAQWLADWQHEHDLRSSGLLIRRLLLECESHSAGVGQQLASPALELQMRGALAASSLSLLQLGAAPLPALPGQPAPLRPATAAPLHWQLASENGEHAALLCLNAPAEDAGWLLAWQALRLQLEAPFFQRLRTEQGLGYIVFCRYRQAASGPQLQFGVQSPHTPPPALQAAILDFLHQPPPAADGWQSALACAIAAGPGWQRRRQDWLGGVSRAQLRTGLTILGDSPRSRLASLLQAASGCG